MITSIHEVVTASDWKEFIRFPEILFKNNPCFIPPLRSDEKKTLSSKSNPAFEYSKARFWIARQDGKTVGRVAAIINRRANEKWNTLCVRFGWFDFIEDIEVCALLLKQVESFGRENGLNKIHGPLGFTDIDKECWVIEGFENQQNISTLYNPPYYIDFIKRLGYNVDCEWMQYKMPASQPIPDKIIRINDLISEKYHVRLLEFRNRKAILPYAHKFFEALNDAFDILYGFVPLTQKEIDAYVKYYFAFLDPELVKFVVDENDEIIAFAIALPSLGPAFKKMNGKLFPFGWIHALKALRKYDSIDLLLNGVRADWQHKGIHAIYHVALNKTAIKKGLKFAYSNPQIIGNMAEMVWNAQYVCEPYFKRAVFSKPIGK
jgi:hypothetical protein